MRKKLKTIFIYLFLSLILFSCNSKTNSESNLKIAVIGDGISKDCNPRIYNINASQGKAVLDGAKHFYENNDFLEKNNIDLVSFGDCGDANVAKKMALKLSRDPNIIAVIGHGTSGTSYAAQDIYKSSGIPLILPIATSDKVCKDSEGRFFKNSFRLPLNDEYGQAPAIYSFINTLKKRKICLIKDISTDAPTYSEPLYNSIAKFIDNDSDFDVDKASYNRDGLSIIDNIITSKIKGNEVLIFCGYGTNANDLLKKIKEKEYLSNLTIVLTDGCQIKNLFTDDLDIYVSFPIPLMIDVFKQYNEIECEKSFNIPISKNSDNSFAMNGYDAMSILNSTIEKLIKNEIEINRKNIIKGIHKQNLFKGKCYSYSLKNGENVLGKYYIYKYVNDSIKMEKEYNYAQLQDVITNFNNKWKNFLRGYQVYGK